MTIVFVPPLPVRREAQLGLKLREVYGRGGTRVGITRAHQLAKGENVSLKTVKRMKAFFTRHYKNRNTVNRRGEPGNGRIAWLLWGGDAGFRWAKEVVKWADKEGIN